MARKLDIDWPELQLAFDSSFGEASCYLDRETGTVVTVTEDIRAAADDVGFLLLGTAVAPVGVEGWRGRHRSKA